MNGAGPPQALTAEGLTTVFHDAGGGRILALDGVTASFRRGSLSALVGPSGSGKTTLIHALAGIVVPAAGKVRFGEAVVSGMTEKARDAWRLATCGLVFQDFRLIEELDALENTLLPARFRQMHLSSALRQRAARLLERFDVPRRTGPVSRLSRGEQQRVALARTLLLDPPVILADEPTASLDHDNARRIAASLRGLAAEGRIVVTVTHDERLSSVADEVLTLRAGTLSGAAQAGH